MSNAITNITVKNLFNRDKKLDISMPTIPLVSFLIGPNGFGKTTILNLIYATFGEISFNDAIFKEIYFDEFKIKFWDSHTIIVKRLSDSITSFTIKRKATIVVHLEFKFDSAQDDYDISIRKDLLKKHGLDRNVVYIREDRFYNYNIHDIHGVRLSTDEYTTYILRHINTRANKNEIYLSLKEIMDERNCGMLYNVSLVNDESGPFDPIINAPMSVHFNEPLSHIPAAILDDFNIFASIIMNTNTDDDTIVLIDIPEMHKHIAIQEMFSKDVMQNSKNISNIIIVTHSPYITHRYTNLVCDNKITELKTKTKTKVI